MTRAGRLAGLFGGMQWAGLWLFALLGVLSIAAQNVFWFALAGWLGQRLWVERRWPALPRLGWLWLAFLAWALLASAMSENAAHSLFTWRKWLLGVTAWCVADAVRDRVQLKGLLGTLLLAAALVNVGAALWFGTRPFWAWAQGQDWAQVASHWVYDTEWRARGGSGGYMVLAGIDALLLAFYGGLIAMDRAWRRPLALACFAALGLGLLLTMTRGAWLAAGAGLGALLLWKRPRWALGLVAGGLLALWIFPQSVFARRLGTVFDADNDSNRERIYLAEVGAKIIRLRPWLGVGDAIHSWERPGLDGPPQRVDGWFMRLRSPAALAWYQGKLIPEKDNGHLHNAALQWAAMYGLPGLAFALLFYFGLIGWGLRAAADRALDDEARGLGLGLVAALATLGLHSLTEYNVGSFQTGFVVWFVIGLTAAGLRLARKARA